jgi:hypothetical protein
VPVHVARQRLCAAPHRQARPKRSPGANNVFQGLILKIILKRVKIKKSPQRPTMGQQPGWIRWRSDLLLGLVAHHLQGFGD